MNRLAAPNTESISRILDIENKLPHFTFDIVT